MRSQTLLVWANASDESNRSYCTPYWFTLYHRVEDSELGFSLAVRHVNLAKLPVVVEFLSSELHSECVVELLHGDHSILIVVKSSHKRVFLMVCDEDVHTTDIS